MLPYHGKNSIGSNNAMYRLLKAKKKLQIQFW